MQRILERLLGDAHALQLRHRLLLGLLLGQLADPHRRQREVLEHREVREQVELLEYHADVAAHGVDRLDVVAQLDTVDGEAAGLMLLEPVDAADQRRLARARRAADHDALALAHLQPDVAQHVELAVPLVDVVEVDDRCVGGHGSVVCRYWRRMPMLR